MKSWVKIIIACTIVILFLTFPPTRYLVWFILPLGSGIDDLIILIAAAVIALVIFYKAITYTIMSLLIRMMILFGSDEETINEVRNIQNKFKRENRK